MIKKTITSEDFDGNQKTKDYYFHMNQVEFAKLNSEVPGGLEKTIQDIIANQDQGAMLRLVDLLVSRSYGERDEEDGGFTKIGKNGRPLYEKFVNTSAYDNLIIELIQGEKNIVTFLSGIMPKEVQARMDEEFKKQKAAEQNGQGRLTPFPGN